MAPCNGDCANLNLALDQGGQNVKWFKIDAKGYDTSAKRWASDDVIAGTTLSIEMSLGLVIYGSLVCSWCFLGIHCPQRSESRQLFSPT
jgi:hypothetical protein